MKMSVGQRKAVALETEVKSGNGFKKAGSWLLGFAWLGLVFAGLAIAFTPSQHSPALGWSLLAIAACVLIVTMDRWVKVFPGLLAFGVLGSVLTLIDGHVVNHPEVTVPRLEGAVMTLFFVAAAVVSFAVVKHRLTVPDRLALFIFVFCFFWQAVAPRFLLTALAIGLSCLIAAWAYDRYQVNI
jgi:hypothetical protein